MKRLRLHLGRIEDELRDVQRHFPAINAVLNLRRDDFSDAVRQNMVTAYEFLDALVDEDLDLFSDEGLEALLQLAQAIIRDSKNGFGCRAGRASTWVAAARKTVRNSSVSVTAENCSLARPALALRIRKISQRRTYAKKGNIRATWQPTTRKVPLRWSRSIART